MADELSRRGVEVFGELMGEERKAIMADAVENPKGFASGMAKLATQFAFASVWDRDGLERKQRSLITLGILLAQRQTLEFKNHVRIALRNGLTPRELEEVLFQAVPYVGFPAVSSATSAMLEVMREEGIDTETATSEERGLL